LQTSRKLPVENEVPRTTKEVNRYVIRDTAGTLIALVIYVLLVLWLIPWAHGLAVTLFWIGALVTGLRAIQIFSILTTGVILFFARRSGWKPVGEDPDTTISGLVRVVEFSVVLYGIYYLYAHLYSHSRFLFF
jgi:hypothetical protein